MPLPAGRSTNKNSHYSRLGGTPLMADLSKSGWDISERASRAKFFSHHLVRSRTSLSLATILPNVSSVSFGVGSLSLFACCIVDLCKFLVENTKNESLAYCSGMTLKLNVGYHMISCYLYRQAMASYLAPQ
jgi:hypothetical protein